MSWSPSIVPGAGEPDVYLVIDDLGSKFGCWSVSDRSGIIGKPE